MEKIFKQYGINIMYMLVFAVIFMFFLWASYDYQKTVKDNLLSEARIISFQMSAMRTYLQRKHDALNKNSAGEYEFKGIYPDIAVKEITDIMKGTPYFTVRLVSLAPRNEANIADDFETSRLKTFNEKPGVLELYDEGSIGGHKVFRYMIPLRADPTCLLCHGGKKGDIDVTGFKKEGYAVGDLIGSLSVVIQSYNKYSLLRRNMSVLLVFIFLLIFSIGIIIYYIRISFDERLAEAQAVEKVSSVSSVMSDTYNTEINDKFHKLLMHNLQNPVGDVLSSAEMLSDVPMNVLERSLTASNKISAYSSKMIELKRIEQGKFGAILAEFDFTSAFKLKLKAYEGAANKNSVSFEGKTQIKETNIKSDKTLLFKAMDYVFLTVLKFSKKQTGKIFVSSTINANNNSIIVTMTNDSRRISVASENMIFNRFADIKDSNENFMFNTEVELVSARMILKHINCDLSFDVENKEKNVFVITIPVLTKDGII